MGGTQDKSVDAFGGGDNGDSNLTCNTSLKQAKQIDKLFRLPKRVLGLLK
jgi:hypothetical protein